MSLGLTVARCVVQRTGEGSIWRGKHMPHLRNMKGRRNRDQCKVPTLTCARASTRVSWHVSSYRVLARVSWAKTFPLLPFGVLKHASSAYLRTGVAFVFRIARMRIDISIYSSRCVCICIYTTCGLPLRVACLHAGVLFVVVVWLYCILCNSLCDVCLRLHVEGPVHPYSEVTWLFYVSVVPWQTCSADSLRPIYIYMYTHTHTHTYIYIYIYSYIPRCSCQSELRGYRPHSIVASLFF